MDYFQMFNKKRLLQGQPSVLTRHVLILSWLQHLWQTIWTVLAWYSFEKTGHCRLAASFGLAFSLHYFRVSSHHLHGNKAQAKEEGAVTERVPAQGCETGGSHWLLPLLQAQEQGSRESCSTAVSVCCKWQGHVLPSGARNPQPGQLS